MSATTQPAPARSKMRKRGRRTTSLFAHGEPLVWLTGGSLVVCLLMVAGLLGIVIRNGGATFLVRPIEQFTLADGTQVMGQITNQEVFRPEIGVLESMTAEQRAKVVDQAGEVERLKLRLGNFDLTGVHYRWLLDVQVEQRERPDWAMVLERVEWGRFYGVPQAFLVDGEVVADTPEGVWEQYGAQHAAVRELLEEVRTIEKREIGELSDQVADAEVAVRSAERRHGAGSPEHIQALDRQDDVRRETDLEFQRLNGEIDELRTSTERFVMRMRTADGTEVDLPLSTVVRAVPANRLGFAERVGVYGSRWKEFLLDEPRESNSEGGVYPAIIGTIVMTLIMSILVVPFGVLAALYLHEYAKQGFIVSIVRIAVNNLAGVPSIVFGVFGLGFFCYIVGASLDDLFFADKLPNPTFGKTGLMWASLTLALLTLPVVIVATEEALAAVPGSMREGSYACGATHWQTVRRIILPRALPGILTGTILAIARGAGEVAPLMLVGAVKLAPDLPVDFGQFPYIFPERSFMHLGFHIYDVGFQSQNSEAARPLVFTTTLLLIGIVVLLNVVAMRIRSHLRHRFQSAH